MRNVALAAAAAIVVGGCASGPSPSDAPVAVRGRAPVNYENTITNYFDFMLVDDPAQRKLVFAPPEASHCALLGGGGAHQGYVVPVIYDTTYRPPPKAVASSSGPAQVASAGGGTAAAGKNTKDPKSTGKNTKKPPTQAQGAVNTSGTAAAATPATAADPPGPITASAITLKDVNITGNRYFFWFSNETISAVTRRMDLCP